MNPLLLCQYFKLLFLSRLLLNTKDIPILVKERVVVENLAELVHNIIEVYTPVHTFGNPVAASSSHSQNISKFNNFVANTICIHRTFGTYLIFLIINILSFSRFRVFEALVLFFKVISTLLLVLQKLLRENMQVHLFLFGKLQER